MYIWGGFLLGSPQQRDRLILPGQGAGLGICPGLRRSLGEHSVLRLSCQINQISEDFTLRVLQGFGACRAGLWDVMWGFPGTNGKLWDVTS